MNSLRFRRFAVATAMLALCSAAGFAQAPDNQQPPPPGQMAGRPGGPERELQALTQVLTLTPEQQTGVKAILQERASQMRALRAKSQGETTPTPDARQANMTQAKQIAEESNTRISALLDDNQKKLFAEWTAKRQAQMERRRERNGGAPPPDGQAPPPQPNN